MAEIVILPEFAANQLCPLHRRPCERPRGLLARARGGGRFRNRHFNILYCPTCHLGFSDPIPTEKTAHLLYDSRESLDFQPDDSSIAFRLKALAARREVRSFCRGLRIPEDARFLDYGCGNGALVRAIQEVFPRAYAVGADLHFSPPPLLSRRDYVPYAELGEMPAFDFVLCRHVLEHSYDPVALLGKLAAFLKPGGVLAVEVPSLDTKLKEIFGQYWDGYYAPFHTVHFREESLSAALVTAGLDVIRSGRAEMPKIGRSIQNVLGCDYNVFLFLTGVLLHPLQVAVGALTGTSVCLRAWGRRPT